MDKYVHNSSGKILLAVFVILYSVEFFHVLFIPSNLYSYSYIWPVLIICMMFLLAKGNIFLVKTRFSKLLRFYLFFLLLNCITCYYFRGQSIIVSLRAWRTFFLIFFFFTFKTWRLNIEGWERVLKIIFLILLSGYTLQYIFIRTPLFELETDFDYLETESRIRIYSDGLLTLGGIFCCNKFLVRNNRSYLLMFLWASLIIFLQGFRMILLSYSVVCVIMLFRVYGFNKKLLLYIIGGGIILGVALQQEIVQNKINEITTRNETANFDNEDYVRVLCLNYFLDNFFLSPTEQILGGGQPILNGINPSKTPSNYSKFRSSLAAYQHFFTVDLGLVGLTIDAGIPFTITFIWIIVMIIFTKVDKSYLYLGMWELMVLLSGFTHPIAYYHANLIYHALILIILDIAHDQYILKESHVRTIKQ